MTRDEAIEFLEGLESSEEIKDALGVLTALKTANEDAKTNREKVQGLEANIAGLEGFKSKAKSTAIARELKARGVKNPDRLIKLIDSEAISFDEDGTLAGMDEQYEIIASEFPEILDPKRQAPNIDQFKNEKVDKAMSATEQQLQMLFSRNKD